MSVRPPPPHPQWPQWLDQPRSQVCVFMCVSATLCGNVYVLDKASGRAHFDLCSSLFSRPAVDHFCCAIFMGSYRLKLIFSWFVICLLFLFRGNFKISSSSSHGVKQKSFVFVFCFFLKSSLLFEVYGCYSPQKRVLFLLCLYHTSGISTGSHTKNVTRYLETQLRGNCGFFFHFFLYTQWAAGTLHFF